MKIKKITNYLLKTYPLDLQEEWDESGYLNRGNINQDITHAFVCLDINEKVVDEAIKHNVKLIISHHPIFRNDPEKMLSIDKKLISKIKKAKITVLSLHTCFDNSDSGMNFLIGTKLKLNNLRWYPDSQFVIGNLSKSLSTKMIANKFKQCFGVSLLTTNANSNDKFKQLVICGGAGLSVFKPKFALLSGKNYLLVTGDINHHGWQDLTRYNIKALDVGHDLENCFCDFMASLIKKEFDINCLSITTKKRNHSI